MKLSVGFGDGMLIDAGQAALHQAVVIELPVLVAIGTKPVAAVVAVLVGKAHGDTVAGVGPEFLDETVVKFARPLAGEKRSMASRPWMNSARLRHWLSAVYACATLAGSRPFHASSAMRTFWMAVAWLKGGRGGRVINCSVGQATMVTPHGQRDLIGLSPWQGGLRKSSVSPESPLRSHAPMRLRPSALACDDG